MPSNENPREPRTPAELAAEAAAAPRGILCPDCGCRDLRVLRTERQPGGRIMRRRACRHCGRRVTTYERPAGY